MSDWAKKLREIKYGILNTEGLGHREHCSTNFFPGDNCDCESSEIFEIAQGAAKHIEIIEELLEDIIPDLECIQISPQLSRRPCHSGDNQR